VRVLITGAGRGIGLALTREYVRRGDTVFAGYRSLHGAPELQGLQKQHGDRVIPVGLEVTSEEAIASAVARVRDAGGTLDVLINNAGISPGDVMTEGPDGTSIMDPKPAMEMFEVNAIAPLRLAQAAAGLLRGGDNPRIVNISSGAGSLTYKTEGGLYSYSASKAALNMYSRALAWDLKGDGIIVIVLDPGFAKTDMGGPDAWIEPEESAEGVIKVIDSLDLDDTGKFFHYQGGEVPW
jgi:NAD(P)-dependent dehydrogenase (short-subunit alcohol dehydrogenase family)